MAVVGRAVRAATRGVPLLRDVSFVLTKPSWPESVPKPPVTPSLGADYDTEWARRPLARAARVAMIEGITRPTIKAIASPAVHGADRLEKLDGPVVFAANHASHIDTSLILTCLPARVRHKTVVAAGADYFFDKHWKAVLWALWVNIIPIERERVGRKSADLAARLIEEGWNLVIFPEGTRSRDGFVGQFRGGAAYLGLRCGVPVIPVHIEGTRRIFGVGSRRVKPGRTRVVCGEPMRERADEKPRDYNVRIEQAVAIAADEGRTDWWTARRNAASARTPSVQGPVGVSGWRKSWLGGRTRVSRPARRWPS